MREYLWQNLIAIDQLANTLTGGWADETISSRAFRQRHESRLWAASRVLIDLLFLFDPNHCEAAYQSEQHRKHLPIELR